MITLIFNIMGGHKPPTERPSEGIESVSTATRRPSQAWSTLAARELLPTPATPQTSVTRGMSHYLLRVRCTTRERQIENSRRKRSASFRASIHCSNSDPRCRPIAKTQIPAKISHKAPWRWESGGRAQAHRQARRYFGSAQRFKAKT
jgi:hypothetical protein